jgi:hypothetical protein
VQHFELARSTSGRLDGPWQAVGRPDIRVYRNTVENYQFVQLAGRWNLLATSNRLDEPWLFELAGDPATPDGWLHWSPGRKLDIALEPFERATGATGDAYEHANCAFLVAPRPIDGWYYLFFSDSPTKATISGEGPATLDIARSRDLVKWDLPPN